MLLGISDIETDGLDPTVIHCWNIKVVDTRTGRVERTQYYDISKGNTIAGPPKVDKWVFHNGLDFDVKVLNDFLDGVIDPSKVLDTFIVSRLVNYSKFRTHSLKELGMYLGVYKDDYTGGWETRTTDMVDYCWQDIEVTHAILRRYWKYIIDPQWAPSMKVEHEMATICSNMGTNGFTFNEEKAMDLLHEVKTEMAALEGGFSRAFPPKRVEAKRLKYKKKKDGTLFSGISRAMLEYPDYEVTPSGDEVAFYTVAPFKPGSPKDRIDVLWEAGWKPYEKTKGHKDYYRSLWKGRVKSW